MSAIDRVMRAYASKRDLNPSQAALVRDELSKFIEELMAGPRRPPMMFPETNGAVGNRDKRQKTTESVDSGER
jgi:hypothetical protein